MKWNEGRFSKRPRHGLSAHPAYGSWLSMMQRCYRENNGNYYKYGGAGINVDIYWHDVRSFIKDMGDTYFGGAQLDRIDNSRGYSKANCRWATRTQQNRNKRTNLLLEFRGRMLTAPEISEVTGVNPALIRQRIIRDGWSVEMAATKRR